MITKSEYVDWQRSNIYIGDLNLFAFWIDGYVIVEKAITHSFDVRSFRGVIF